MDLNPNERADDPGKRALETLQEYVLVGKRHVKVWQVWLLIGLAVGIAAGIILVANRGGEFEVGRAEVKKSIPVDQLASGGPPGSPSAFFTGASSSQAPVELFLSVPGGGRVLLGETRGNVFFSNLPQEIANASSLHSASGHLIKLSRPSLAEKYESLNTEIQWIEADLQVATATSTRILLEQKIEDLTKGRKSKLLAHLALMSSEQDRAENSIRAMVPRVTFKTRFSRSFNGLHVEALNARDVRRLKDAGYTLYPNQGVRAVLMDSVPLIGANQVWQFQDSQGRNITGQGMNIAIIDTGVDYTHRDLGGCFGPGCKVQGGYDVVNNDPDPMDDHGHGTHVAAIAAGNGALKGVAPDANVYAYKVLNSGGSGSWSGVIAGLDRALDPNQDGDLSDRADVINFSLGGFGDPDDPMSQAVDNAVRAGSVVAAAAGNYGSSEETILAPGVARKAITVAASTKTDSVTWFSSRGPVIWNNQSIVKPDLAAPGEFICAAEWNGWLSKNRCLDNEHISISGTSMAAPHVAGAVALIRQAHPSWTPEEVKASLKNNTKNIGWSVLDRGSGRLDVPPAVSVTSGPPPVATLDPIPVAGMTRTIQGAMTVRFLKEWSLAYAPYSPSTPESNWQDLVRSSALPSGPALYTLDLNAIPDGKYIVRLLVEDAAGAQGVDYGYLLVDKWNVALPLDSDIYRGGDSIPLQLSLIPGFTPQGILWEYQAGGSWGAIGTQASDMWNTSGLATGWYTIRVMVTDSGVQSQETVKVYLDTTLKKGWPVRIIWDSIQCPPYTCYYWPGFLEPAVSDLDGDGIEEIVVYRGGDPPTLLVYHPDGSLAWSRSVGTTDAPGGNLHIPVIADVNRDGKKEIFAYKFLETDYSQSELYGFHADGNLLPGWPVKLPHDDKSTILAADLDKDGIMEVIIQGNGGYPSKMTVVSADGKIIAQWDLSLDSWFSLLDSTPAVGNFDQDNELEIVVTKPSPRSGYDPVSGAWINEGEIHVFNMDGTEVSGWPKLVPGQPFSSPAVGDLDLDGKNEIVVGLLYSSNIFPDPSFGGLYAFDEKGNLLPGWPVMVGYKYWSSPALSDLDGDGDLEITASRLGFFTEAYHHDGQLVSGWPQQTSWNDYYATIVGDVNGDTLPDVLTTAGDVLYGGGGVYAWTTGGQPLPGFPKGTEVDAQAPATISDLDQDGKIDIAASSDWDWDSVKQTYKNRSSLYLWDTGAAIDSKTMHWPTFHRDAERRGLYQSPIPPLSDLKADGSDGPITIPYNALTTLTWCGAPPTPCKYANSCEVTMGPNAPPVAQGTSGTHSTGSLSVDTVYTLTCTGPGGTSSDSVTVNVMPYLPDLTIPTGGVSKIPLGYSYRILVSNVGSKESGPWELLAKDATGLRKKKIYESLGPGASVVVNGNVLKLPVTFTVDPQNKIKEQDENNNSLTMTAITPVPSLSPAPALPGP